MGQELARELQDATRKQDSGQWPPFPLVWTANPQTVMFHVSYNFYGHTLRCHEQPYFGNSGGDSWRDAGSVLEIRKKQEIRQVYHSVLISDFPLDLLHHIDELLFSKDDFAQKHYCGGN